MSEPVVKKAKSRETSLRPYSFIILELYRQRTNLSAYCTIKMSRNGTYKNRIECLFVSWRNKER